VITIILLGYLGCVYAAFKVIKIKVSPVSVAVAILIGVFAMGGIVTGWKLVAPMTDQMTLKRNVLQIIPDVREFVTKVHVKSDQMVNKGDPLFEISSQRFQNAVDQSAAALAAAEATVSQLEAAVAAAEAGVKQSKASTGIAKAELAVAKDLKRSSPGAIAKLQFTEAEQSYQAALASDEVAEASLKQVQASLTAATHSVEVSRAELNIAQFNLDRTIYRSSVDGRVMNLQVREQSPVARWKFTTVGTLMQMSGSVVMAVYPQNLLSFVQAGDSAEVAFKRMPGVVAAGKVAAVVKYTGEGQYLASGTLPVAADVGSRGFLVVRIKLDDDDLARKLPLGAAGMTAIYTSVGKPFHVISKISLRIKAWTYYLPT
jgi:multidrug resistance efflux pump